MCDCLLAIVAVGDDDDDSVWCEKEEETKLTDCSKHSTLTLHDEFDFMFLRCFSLRCCLLVVSEAKRVPFL